MIGLKEKALKSIKWTAISSLVAALTQLIQVIVLSHFLAPNDFGLMALALVVIGFSQMFIDMGVSNAIIHNQNISKRQLDSLYWLNIFSGLIVFLLLILLAPFVSDFYDEPRLTSIVRWISLGFIIQPFEQQFLVLLKKELKFNEIARRDVLSKLTSFFLSVLLAILGFGVYSLVIANLVAIIFSAVLIIYIGLKHHRPGFYFNFKEIRPSFNFGLFQMGENFINYFVSQFDTILIGKLLGLEALGIYNVAKNLAMRPSQIINPIVTQIGFPLMAKIQNDTEKLRDVYLKIINYLSLLNFPIYIFVVVFADQIVLILFGDKWLQAIPIFKILSLYALVRSTANPVGGLLLAKGRADLGFYWNFALFLLIPASVYLGSYYGLIGAAVTLLSLQLILVVPGWYFLIYKLCDAKFEEYMLSILVPLLIACSAGVLTSFVLYLPIGNYLRLIIGMPLFIAFTILFNRIFSPKLFFELKALKSGII